MRHKGAVRDIGTAVLKWTPRTIECRQSAEIGVFLKHLAIPLVAKDLIGRLRDSKYDG